MSALMKVAGRKTDDADKKIARIIRLVRRLGGI